MKNLQELRDIRQEVLEMSFDFKNVHRIMFLVYEAKDLFGENHPIPNKDIALHQTNKVIGDELMKLVRSKNEKEIEKNFNELIESFKLVLAYIA
ncbi:MAG: hypothetical protein JEZ09_15680 [Salinivirgaceae bacterium]|nr:hypothetical protein [Salinivirgaceae bacterium]